MKKNIFLSILFSFFIHLSGCTSTDLRPDESIAGKIYQKQNRPRYVNKNTFQAPFVKSELNTIALFCCNHVLTESLSWSNIASQNPDLVIAAGNSVSSVKLDEKPLNQQYEKLDANDSYRSLRAKVPFMATWDDLDYGIRFGDSNYQEKEQSRQDFTEYWDYIKSFQPKRRPQGIEHAIIFGSKGRRVQVIMLDLRFYTSSWIEDSKGEFKKNWKASASLLGSKQWRWLSAELKKPAELRIIISPLQVGANNSAENRWGLLPHQRQKLFDLIRGTAAKNTLIVSGNRHFGSFAKVDLKNYGSLYDMTVGPLSGPTAMAEKDFHYLNEPLIEQNFGLIKIDWSQRSATLQLINRSNTVAQELKFNFIRN